MKRVAKRTDGFDSQFERDVNETLKTLRDAGLMNNAFRYNKRNKKEGVCFSYNVPRDYYPDFIFTKKDGKQFFVEVKGWLKPCDRIKAIWAKRDNPGVDFRFLFQHDNWLTKRKAQRYSQWATKNGFKFGIGTIIPDEWLNE